MIPSLYKQQQNDVSSFIWVLYKHVRLLLEDELIKYAAPLTEFTLHNKSHACRCMYGGNEASGGCTQHGEMIMEM